MKAVSFLAFPERFDDIVVNQHSYELELIIDKAIGGPSERNRYRWQLRELEVRRQNLDSLVERERERESKHLLKRNEGLVGNLLAKCSIAITARVDSKYLGFSNLNFELQRVESVDVCKQQQQGDKEEERSVREQTIKTVRFAAPSN